MLIQRLISMNCLSCLCPVNDGDDDDDVGDWRSESAVVVRWCSTDMGWALNADDGVDGIVMVVGFFPDPRNDGWIRSAGLWDVGGRDRSCLSLSWLRL